MVAQARQSAALRELEQQQEERAALAQESKIPVGEQMALEFNVTILALAWAPARLVPMCARAAVKDLTWERPLEIITYPDPRLRAVNARIGVFDERVKQLGQEMLEVMYNGSAPLHASPYAV